jgi:hypothetical protein
MAEWGAGVTPDRILTAEATISKPVKRPDWPPLQPTSGTDVAPRANSIQTEDARKHPFQRSLILERE